MRRIISAAAKLNCGKREYAVFVLWAATSIALRAQTFTTLHSFDGTDGGFPFAALVQATDGNFYGTTSVYGANTGGTVFEISPNGTLTTLYSFCAQSGCTDGKYPFAAMVQGSDGNFYGTTQYGGASGDGTIFKITPSGTLTTLYSFCAQSGCTDGKIPAAALVQATDGNFYGTTFYGGVNPSPNSLGAGTVFQITPTGTFTTLYSFCSQHGAGNTGCTDGVSPSGALVQANDGNFYGTTAGGGAMPCPTDLTVTCPNGGGTVFKISPNGTLTTLYSFCAQSPCTDGLSPFAGLVQATDGNFYGTTSCYGANVGPTTPCDSTTTTNTGGTVFMISPNGMLTTLYSFCAQSGCVDGSWPVAPLVQATDGNFYGTTLYGGDSGDGTIFKITPSGALTTLHSSCSQSGCPDGKLTYAELVQAPNGNFYATAYTGGASNYGTVFSLCITQCPLQVTTTSLPNATSGQPYSTTLAASGGSGAGYNWSVSSGSLPAGFTLSSAGVLSSTGSPAAPPNSYSFTVQVTDSAGNLATQPLTLVILGPLQITTTSLPNAPSGYPYGTYLAASGGSGAGYNWSVSSGSLPASFTLSSAGVLSSTGSPAAPANSYSFTVQVTDPAGNLATQPLTLVILGPLQITTTSLPNAPSGQPYGMVLEASGGTLMGYNWSVSSGSLPAGFTLLSNLLWSTGSPAAPANSYNFTVQVTDSAANLATQPLTLVVLGPLQITTTSLPNATSGQPYSTTLAATGGSGSGYTWISSRLPDGFTLSSAGVFSSTGSPAAAADSYSFTVLVNDSAGNLATQSLTLVVAGQMVFLIHGIGQSGGALNDLATSLRDPIYGIDQSRFQIDAGFDFGVCANNVGCDQALCTIQNGAKLLASYINQQNPSGNIVLVGYSMGGLIARDMILNNYYNVITNHHVAALITLATPHLGYPYEPIDDRLMCHNLVGQMFGDFRNPDSAAPILPPVASPALDFFDESGNRIALSFYLYDLNIRWWLNIFDRPDIWFAAAGSYCSEFVRPGTSRGCPNGARSDGVVCVDSADPKISNGPDLRFSDDLYSHTADFGTLLLFCPTNGSYPLFNPPANGALIANIQALINGLPAPVTAQPSATRRLRLSK